MGRSRAEVIADLNVALVGAGYSMASASKALGLNHSYLSKFMRNQDYSPEVLPEDVRIGLAQLVGLGEETLRIDPHRPVGIKEGEGIKGYGKRVHSNGDSTDRRNIHMRVDHVIEEIGRIKERLDRLEGRTAEPGHDRPGTRKNPL